MKLSISAETLCAIGLIIFFFLPWGQVFMFRGSGYDFAINIGSYANLAFLIPVFSVITIILGLKGEEKLHKEIAMLTGVLPFLALIYAVLKTGTEIFQVLAIGAYLTIFTGIVMIFISRRSNKNVAVTEELKSESE